MHYSNGFLINFHPTFKMKELLLQTLRETTLRSKDPFSIYTSREKILQVCAWTKVFLKKFCSGTPRKKIAKLNKQNFEILIGCSYEIFLLNFWFFEMCKKLFDRNSSPRDLYTMNLVSNFWELFPGIFSFWNQRKR